MNGRFRSVPAAALVAAAAWLLSVHPVPVAAPAQAAPVVRLHVIANSNSGRDQALKLEVRTALLPVLRPVVGSARTARAAVRRLRSALPNLLRTADRTLKTWDAPYAASVTLGRARFPAKNFGPITLPSGTYTAVTVRLGTGRGQNWWCLLFPQLCTANPLVATEQGERASAPEVPLRAGRHAAATEPVWRWLWQAVTRL